eukprot:1156142-Pelagomonas_calceolata.AAC.11
MVTPLCFCPHLKKSILRIKWNRSESPSFSIAVLWLVWVICPWQVLSQKLVFHAFSNFTSENEVPQSPSVSKLIIAPVLPRQALPEGLPRCQHELVSCRLIQELSNRPPLHAHKVRLAVFRATSAKACYLCALLHLWPPLRAQAGLHEH